MEPQTTLRRRSATNKHLSKDHPRNVAALFPRLNFQPVDDDTRDILEVHPHILQQGSLFQARGGNLTAAIFLLQRGIGTHHGGACMMQETNTRIQTARVEAVG